MILPHRERTSSIMASIKYDEYKVKLNNLKPTLDDLGQSLGLEAAAEELDLLQAQSAAEDFWNDMEKAQKVSQRIKNLQDKLDAQQKRLDTVEDLLVLCEMGQEADDDSMVAELEESYAKLDDKDDHANYKQAINEISKIKNKAEFHAITSVPCFEFWLLLHFCCKAKPFRSVKGKSAAEQVVCELQNYIPRYKKGDN